MQISRSLAALAVLLLIPSAALAAQVTGSSSGVAPQANNIPYTLSLSTTIVQTLSDGTKITRAFTEKVARDSEGRTYSEMHETLHIRADGQPDNFVNFSVFDPVARTRTNWRDRTKVATVMHMPDPQTVQHPTQPMHVPELEAAQQAQTVRTPTQVSREELGVRTIAGIEAKGTRTTSIIPAGDVGNDRPLTVVVERWMSTQYNVQLLHILDDPRTGKRTEEVTEFQPGEPDPALFKIPAGYTVRENTAF